MSNENLEASNEQIDSLCEGLVQNAAKVRYLKRLGLHVERRPNGRPLVFLADIERLHARRMSAAAQTQTTAANGPRWKKPAGG